MKLSSKKLIYSDIVYKSLIGKKIEIVNSTNKNLIGLKGEIQFESANLFYIKTKEGIKKVLKSIIEFVLEHDEEKYSIEGNLLKGSIVNRIKKMKL
jgi:RNase P/RNase MRP subunit p29